MEQVGVMVARQFNSSPTLAIGRFMSWPVKKAIAKLQIEDKPHDYHADTYTNRVAPYLEAKFNLYLSCPGLSS